MKKVLVLLLVLVGLGWAGYQSYPYLQTYLEKEEVYRAEKEREINPTDAVVREPYIPHHTTIDVVINIYPYSNYPLALRLERYSDTRTLLPEFVKIDYVGDSIYYWDAGDELHHFLDLRYYSQGLSIEENLEGFRGGWDEGERTHVRNICTLRTWDADGVTYYQLGFDETLWRTFITETYASSRGLEYVGSFCGGYEVRPSWKYLCRVPTDSGESRGSSGSPRKCTTVSGGNKKAPRWGLLV